MMTKKNSSGIPTTPLSRTPCSRSLHDDEVVVVCSNWFEWAVAFGTAESEFREMQDVSSPYLPTCLFSLH